jgi:hypothetical protein
MQLSFATSIRIAYICLTISVCGCRYNNRTIKTIENGDKLYYEYLFSDSIDDKHKRLIEIKKLFDSSKMREADKSHYLSLTYSRLFIVEKARGNSQQAENYFRLAREFRSRHLFANGHSKNSVTEKLESFTQENLGNYITEFDKKNMDHYSANPEARPKGLTTLDN